MFPQVPLFKKLLDFPFLCWFLYKDNSCHHKGFKGRGPICKNIFNPETSYSIHFFFFWGGWGWGWGWVGGGTPKQVILYIFFFFWGGWGWGWGGGGGKVHIPKWASFALGGKPIRSPENPGTITFSNGHWFPCPGNFGCRTRVVWDNILDYIRLTPRPIYILWVQYILYCTVKHPMFHILSTI